MTMGLLTLCGYRGNGNAMLMYLYLHVSRELIQRDRSSIRGFVYAPNP